MLYSLRWGINSIMSFKISEEKISKLKTSIERFSKTSLISSEANTKKRIIEPLIEMLNWDFESDEVRLEHPVQIGSRTSKVDYALVLEGKPVVFIEAKSFDTELAEDESNQIISYGRVDDVRWAALTNGRVIKVFDTKAGKTEKKCIIGEVHFTKLPVNFEELMLIHRDSILSGEIESAVERLVATRKAIRNLKQKRNQLMEEFQTTLLKITGDVVKQRVQNISSQLANQAIQLFETQIQPKSKIVLHSPTLLRDEIINLAPGEVIVCPSKPDGVEFLKKYNAWGFINMSDYRRPKYFALYVGSPESSVKYFGEIESITKPIQSKDELTIIQEEDMDKFETGKRVIHLKLGSLIELRNPIPLKSKRRGLRGPKYSTLEKIKTAQKLSDL